MKNIIILGATGSTGLYLTEYLWDKKNYKIIATGLRKRDNEYYHMRGIDYLSIDITEMRDFEKLPQKNIHSVVLLAGMMPARMRDYDPYQYLDINIKGTLNVLEYCRKNKIPQIIFTLSHSDVFGHWDTGQFINEDAHQKLNLKGDHAIYIISKVSAAQLIEHYQQEYAMHNIIFRLPTIYCYWPDSTFYVNGEKREIGYLSLIKKAINGEPIEIWGDPSKPKDIVYVKDFAQLVEKAIIDDNAHGTFNVGTGIPTTLDEQIKGIIEVFCGHKKSELIYRPEMPSQISYLYDVTKAKRELGYEVKYPYLEMLTDMKKEMDNPIFKQILG